MPQLNRKKPEVHMGPATGERDQTKPAFGASSLNAVPTERRWLYRGLMAIALPVCALLFAELLLRVVGFGHPTAFLVRSQVGGKAVLVENPWFGLRFFPPSLVRSPNPVVMEAQKPPGVYRIFLFGESAALGDPRPAYGVGRYLETLLRQRFPGTEFEVVCVAMTAINSHAVLPIARECTQYQGDLWIVYMGNNEFVGPFGASTVFGPQAPLAIFVRGYLALQRTRVGQGLVGLARHFNRTDTAPSWGGLGMFIDNQISPSDVRKDRVYGNFQHNLSDILQAGVDSKVPIILSSVACNLKDCPPFASTKPSGLDTAPFERWKSWCEQGATNLEQARFTEAIDDYTAAVKLSPQHAELQFRLGQCFLATTNLKSAAESFSNARDWDTLPFRADSKINQVIAMSGDQYKGEGVVYLDAENVLAPSVTSPIAGNEFFYEHVHLNFEGNYRLARAFADCIASRLPRAVVATQTAGWAEPEVCAMELGLTDWNRYTAFEEISRRLSDAPYTNQLNQALRLQELRQQMAGLKGRLQPAAQNEARLVYEKALQKRPRDHWLHHNYAEFLTGIGELAQATVQMEAVRDLAPDNFASYLQLGRVLVLQKRFDEALLSLQTAASLRPDAVDIYLELGQVYARQGKLEKALKEYATVQKLQPRNAGVRLLRAQLLEQQNKRQEAIENLREAARLRPSYYEAHNLLGMELGLDGKHAEAATQFAEAVRLRPDKADGHLNLGMSLARQGIYTEALEQFRTVLRLDPQNEKAAEFVAGIEQHRLPQSTPQ